MHAALQIKNSKMVFKDFQTLQIESKVNDDVAAGGGGDLGFHESSSPTTSLFDHHRPRFLSIDVQSSRQGGGLLPHGAGLYCRHRLEQGSA